MKKDLSQLIAERYLHAFDSITTEQKTDAKTLCKQLGISEGTISQLRGGHTKSIKAEMMVELCQKHKYSLTWMATGKGEERTTDEVLDLKGEIKHIKEILGNIIEPLLNEVLQIKGKAPKKDELLKGNLWNKS